MGYARLLSIILPLAFSGGPITEKPGPYELEGSILAALQFFFTMMIVIGKFKTVRISASILSAITGGAAFVVYYINQTSVGNPLYFGPLAIFGAGVIYGTVIAVILIIGVVKQRKLKKSVAERVAAGPYKKRRFDD